MMCPPGATFLLEDMVAHFTDSPEFHINFLQDEDPLGVECHLLITNHLTGVTELRPPAGFYLSLSSGAEVPAELPSEAPPFVRWLPAE
eukprot:4187393-Alexandrium_andersonii.AAC.1